MTEILTRLLRQADLFDDPAAYEAGVYDTFAALTDAGAVPGDRRRARGQDERIEVPEPA